MTARLSSADYVACFVCDEVRREDSGKLLPIGVYVSNIMVRSVPIEIGLSIVFRMKIKRAGIFENRFRVLLDGEQLVELSITAETRVLREEVGFTPRFGVPIKGFGLLQFQLSDAENPEWQTILEIPVEEYKG